MRRQSKLGIVIFILLGVGIVAAIINSPREMLIPIIILGVVFLLYKFPPNRMRGRNSRFSRFAPPKTKQKKRSSPFKVIHGNKKDDDPPQFH